MNGSHLLDRDVWSDRDGGAAVTEWGSAAVRRWTRAELAIEIDDLASRMSERWRSLATTNRVVGVWMPGSVSQAMHVWAALRAGLCPAVLTPPTPRMERSFYERSAQPTALALGAAMIVSDLGITVPGGPTIVAPTTFEVVATGLPGGTDVDDDVAMIQLSSGTTGVKKAVVLTHNSVMAQLDAYGAAVGLGADDVIVSWLPLYHDMGFVTCVLLAPAFGAHTVMLDPFDWVADPIRWCDAASAERATLSWQPNFALALMAARATPARLEGLDLSSLRHVVCCSEPVTFAAHQAFAERLAHAGLRATSLSGSYAMAETTFAVTHGERSLHDGLDHAGPAGDLVARRPVMSVGTALPGVRIEGRDEHGAPTAEGVVGELVVSAPWLAQRYLAAPGADQARFDGGWFRTGDLGYRRGDQWYVIGRADDVIVVAGHNVLPEDAEAAASGCAGVRPGRSVAFAVDDPRIESQRLVVLVEPDGSSTAIAVTEVGTAVLAAVGAAPTVQVVEPGWILKSSSGKPARRACRDRWLGVHA